MKRRNFLKQSVIVPAVISFPNIIIPAKQNKIGVALVGLGYYSSDVLAPALQLTKHCELRGVVSGSPDKISTWQEKYKLKDQNIYSYDNLHQVANNDDIDVIYIVLPTGLHKQYSIVAADAGKHVWCEKPMAITEQECQDMIDASKKNKVQLTIGYRMQHEPNTRKIMEWAVSKPFGNMRSLIAEAGYQENRSDHWKQKKSMGGGAMYDMGVYPLNAARYTTQLEPLSVNARHENIRKEIYHEVDETTYFNLTFPGGIIANCKTSFGERMNQLEVTCEKGDYYLKPFQAYRGVQGGASDGTVLKADPGNQQARQMDNDALAIIEQNDPFAPGEEGLKDIRIVEAIYKAAANGKEVSLQ